MIGGARRTGPVGGDPGDGSGPVTLGLAVEALEGLRVGRGTRLLDVHAGTGGLSIAAARRGAEVLAVDPAPGPISRLEARGRSEGLDLAGRVMAGRALDLADARFDVVASMHGVSQSRELGRCLQEMVRVARSGGRILIVALGSPAGAEFLTYLTGALHAAVPGMVPSPGPRQATPTRPSAEGPRAGGRPSADRDPPPRLSPRQPGPFQVADPATLARRMTAAGLTDVRVGTTTWHLPLHSATHLWHLATTEIPVAAGLVAALSPPQAGEVRRVLEGMLRERSGGRPGAVLTAAVNIGTGTG